MTDKFDRDQVEQYNTQELPELSELPYVEEWSWPELPDVEEEWSWDDWQYWCRSGERQTVTELMRIWEALP
jgi:hypothetical protein